MCYNGKTTMTIVSMVAQRAKDKGGQRHLFE